MEFLEIVTEERKDEENQNRPYDAGYDENAGGDSEAFLCSRYAQEAEISHRATANHETIGLSLLEPFHFIFIADAVSCEHRYDGSDQPINQKASRIEILYI